MRDTEAERTRLFIEGQRRLDEAREAANRKLAFSPLPKPPQMPEDGGHYPAPGSKRENPLDRLKRANGGTTQLPPCEEPLSDDELGGYTRENFNRLSPERRLQIANAASANRRR